MSLPLPMCGAVAVIASLAIAAFAVQSESPAEPAANNDREEIAPEGRANDDRAAVGDALEPSAAADGSAEHAGGSVERGRYLVHHVAMCVECHTPRDANQRLSRARLLRGAAIPVRPPANMQWAFRAPPIAGLPGWEDESILELLTRGERPDGRAPRPPMPSFRFQEADARAVIAYLRSLR